MQAFPGCRIEEVGLCRLDPRALPPEWGFAPCSLPPIGASPDAMIRHDHVPAAADVARVDLPAATATAAAVAPWDIDGLIARLKVAGTTGSKGGNGGGAEAGRLEVVELKNTSPFRHSRRLVGRCVWGGWGVGSWQRLSLGAYCLRHRCRFPAAEEASCALQSMRWLTEALGSRSQRSGYHRLRSTCCVPVSEAQARGRAEHRRPASDSPALGWTAPSQLHMLPGRRSREPLPASCTS